MITICDVGPRDGLQNESEILSANERVELVDKLAAAGIPRVESASFVNPKLVPAMAGAEEVLAGIVRRPGCVYTGLVLNEKGYARALSAGVDEVRYGFSASDEFGLRNQNLRSGDGLAVARKLTERAHADGKRIGVTISVAFGCPFSGPVDPGRVSALVDQLMQAPPDDISLADTIGVAVPTQVTELVSAAVRSGAVVNGHFHNTRGTGLANAVAALEAGASSLDASVGGIGGCPFAPRATGNICTEDLIYMLDGMGVETGVETAALIAAAEWLSERLGKQLPGMIYRAGLPYADISPTVAGG